MKIKSSTLDRFSNADIIKEFLKRKRNGMSFSTEELSVEEFFEMVDITDINITKKEGYNDIWVFNEPTSMRLNCNNKIVLGLSESIIKNLTDKKVVGNIIVSIENVDNDHITIDREYLLENIKKEFIDITYVIPFEIKNKIYQEIVFGDIAECGATYQIKKWCSSIIL